MEKVKEYLEKAKDRIIHEFEYKNGKYIQHYVLGGEHELTPQEIIDCLNALTTMDCDLQTAYAYIKGQDEENRALKEQNERVLEKLDLLVRSNQDLEQQLTIREKALELACKDIKGTGLFAITDEFESFEDVYIKSAEQKLNKDN